MSLENEVAELRSDVEKLKRRRDQGEEIKHQIWNNMQEDIHKLCRDNHEQLGAFRSETRLEFMRINRRVEGLEEDVATLKQDVTSFKTDVSTLKTDVSTLKTDVSTLKTDVSTLKTDVSTLKSDVSSMKSDLSEIKAILLNKSYPRHIYTKARPSPNHQITISHRTAL